MPATLATTIERQTTDKAKNIGLTFSELPMWAIICINRTCYRKQDNGRENAGLMAHNMNDGGFVKWSEFRQEKEERYIQDGAVYIVVE
jgi:hypothetical protein